MNMICLRKTLFKSTIHSSSINVWLSNEEILLPEQKQRKTLLTSQKLSPYIHHKLTPNIILQAFPRWLNWIRMQLPRGRQKRHRFSLWVRKGLHWRKAKTFTQCMTGEPNVQKTLAHYSPYRVEQSQTGLREFNRLCDTPVWILLWVQ